MIEWLKARLGRTGLPLGIAGAVLILALGLGISKSNLEIILFKFLIFCPSVALVHGIRRTLFPYLDMSQLYEQVNGPEPNQIDVAIVFASVVFLYIAMTYTLVSAI